MGLLSPEKEAPIKYRHKKAPPAGAWLLRAGDVLGIYKLTYFFKALRSRSSSRILSRCSAWRSFSWKSVYSDSACWRASA